MSAGGHAPPGDPWFAISFSGVGSDRITTFLDTVFGGGPRRSRVEVGAGEIRVRMADFRFSVPRSSIRSVRRSDAKPGGTTGVHTQRGRLLVNGSAEGLVEVTIDPPCLTGRSLNTMFIRQPVSTLIVSLADPDGFIAALGTPSSA